MTNATLVQTPETSKRYLPVGSICENRQRSRDIVFRLYDAAKSVAPDQVTSIGWKLGLDSLLATDYDELCDALFQILASHVPPLCYLGSQSSGGLLIGVWLDFDAIENRGMRVVQQLDSDSPEPGEQVVYLNDDGDIMICTRNNQGDIQVDWRSDQYPHFADD